jgi:hypothetical protein
MSAPDLAALYRTTLGDIDVLGIDLLEASTAAGDAGAPDMRERLNCELVRLVSLRCALCKALDGLAGPAPKGTVPPPSQPDSERAS